MPLDRHASLCTERPSQEFVAAVERSVSFVQDLQHPHWPVVAIVERTGQQVPRTITCTPIDLRVETCIGVGVRYVHHAPGLERLAGDAEIGWKAYLLAPGCNQAPQLSCYGIM